MYSLCRYIAHAENLEIICACMCHAHFAIVLQRFVHVAIVNNYVQLCFVIPRERFHRGSIGERGSLVPRLFGGRRKKNLVHCVCMRLIITRELKTGVCPLRWNVEGGV